MTHRPFFPLPSGLTIGEIATLTGAVARDTRAAATLEIVPIRLAVAGRGDR